VDLKKRSKKNIKLEDIDFDVFKIIMEYVMTDIVDINPQSSFDMMCHAQLYGLKNLQDRCEKNLVPFIDDENALLLLESADLYSALDLKKYSMNFVVRNMALYQNTDAYENIRTSLKEEISQLYKKFGSLTKISTQKQDKEKELEKNKC